MSNTAAVSTATVEDEVEASKAPLIEHLIELRSRILKSLFGFLLFFVVFFFFAKEIYNILVIPFHKSAIAAGITDPKLIYTGPAEFFFTQIKVAMFAAAFAACPVIMGQIYAFVAPGLYRNERAAFAPFLAATPVLFVLGAALVYYLIFPLAWRFFLSFETPGDVGTLPIMLEPKVNEYLSLVMTLIFAFGLAFQLPVVLTLLIRAGILSTESLAKKRRYAIVGVFAFAAVVTPPDVISQVGLAIPLLGLYEISILIGRLIERNRARREAAEAAV